MKELIYGKPQKPDEPSHPAVDISVDKTHSDRSASLSKARDIGKESVFKTSYFNPLLPNVPF